MMMKKTTPSGRYSILGAWDKTASVRWGKNGLGILKHGQTHNWYVQLPHHIRSACVLVLKKKHKEGVY